MNPEASQTHGAASAAEKEYLREAALRFSEACSRLLKEEAARVPPEYPWAKSQLEAQAATFAAITPLAPILKKMEGA